MRATAHNGAILIGQTSSSNGDMFLVKLDSAGNATWQRALDNAYDSTAGMTENPPVPSIDRGGALAGRAAPLQLTRDGGAILAGTSTSFAGQEQFWLVKLGRTENINFSYRSGLAGASYSNEHARSSALSSPVADVAVSDVDFASDVRTESTPIVVVQETP